jgi:putative transcriptional regulator
MFKKLFGKKENRSSLNEPIDSFKKEMDTYTNVGQNVFPIIKAFDDRLFNSPSDIIYYDNQNGLRTVFGIDVGDKFIILDKTQLSQMNLSKEEITEVAFRNIRKLASEKCDIGVKDYSKLDSKLQPFYTLKTTKPISPSLMHIDELWDDQLLKVVKDEEIVISMPSKDDIYFSSFNNEGSFWALRIITEKKYEQAKNEGNELSSFIFLRKDNRWFQLGVNADNAAKNVEDPKVGDVLISNPNDIYKSNMNNSVILIFEMTDDFCLGVGIDSNPIETLKDALEDSDHDNISVYSGGIIDTDTLTFLHSVDSEAEKSDLISENVYYGGDFPELMTKYESGEISEKDLFIFKGYYGWKKHQLIGEIQNDGWIVKKATKEMIFNTPKDELYNSLIENK